MYHLVTLCRQFLELWRPVAYGKPSPLFPFFRIASLSSASFIPVATSCSSSIHFLLGHPLLLPPSPYHSFSNPSDRITCPKNPSFLLIAVYWSVSSSSIPISIRTLALVFFSVHEILCIFLHIHISHALITCRPTQYCDVL